LTFCPACGASIEEKDTYCPFCGSPTITEKKEEKSVTDDLQKDVDFPEEVPPPPPQTYQPIAAPGTTSYPQPVKSTSAPQLEIRSFWMWFLLGMITFGIANFVYLYYNIEDLNKLDRHPRPAGVPSTHTDTSNMTILIIIGLFTGFLSIIMIIATYMKHQKLHDYIKAHPQRQQTLPMSGSKYLVFSLCSGFIIGIVVSAVAIPIAFIEDPMLLVIIGPILYGVVGLISLGVAIYLLLASANWQKAYNERARMLCPGTPEKSI